MILKKNKIHNILLSLIVLVHIPIFFINNSWDGAVIDYGFSIKNLDGIRSWYYESSSHFQFLIIKILFYIKNLINLPHEFIFDVFTLFLHNIFILLLII